MATIYLREICGDNILSRANVRKIYDLINDSNEVVDFTGVQFISRSVADELCNFKEANPSTSFQAISGEIEKMLNVVMQGRNKDRLLRGKPKVSIKIQCDNLDDIKKSLRM